MIERIKKNKPEEIRYAGNVPLETLRDVPVNPREFPLPLRNAIDHLSASQGPIFSDFGYPDEDITDVMLETTDPSEKLYLAVRILKDNNSVSGLAVNETSQYNEFYTNDSDNETFVEITIPTAGRESVELITRRMDAVNELSKTRCFSTLYSSVNPHHEALQVWRELEAQGKARKRVMQSGETRYFML